MNSDFVHPLSSLETITTDQGKKQVINSWAFASILWSQTLTGNQNALMMVNELFTDKHEIAGLLAASLAGNEAMKRRAIAIMAFAIDDKIQEAFELKQENENGK